MNRVVAWFAQNHVAANLLMAFLVVGGLVSLPSIKREIFPELRLEMVSISVEYPGTSPEGVEESICARIEEKLQGLQGVKRIRSTAFEGLGRVTVELLSGEDVRRRLDEIRTRVDAIDTFPAAARRPLIEQIAMHIPVLDVAVTGNVDEWMLKRLGEKVRDELAALPEITDTDLVGDRAFEISIEISEDSLRRFGLTFDDVVAAVQRSSIDLPGGSVKTAGGEILLRTVGQAYRGQDFEELLLVSGRDGSRLRLGDVARIVDGFEETDQRLRFDGTPAVLVHVYRVGPQSALAIADAVRDYVERAELSLPEGVSLTVTQNDARFLRGRLDTLLRNARSGFVLVILVLALFLRLRLALWVGLGVPLSFLGALLILPVLDVSINLISLMGFIVVLGIVVDDAIIVGENTHSEQSRTGDSLAGAIRGANGVATPVIFGVLTTVAAFAPMLSIEGPMGRIARVIPIVVIACLIFSLLESLFVLPAHLGHGHSSKSQPKHAISRSWRRFQDRVDSGLAAFIHGPYRRVLGWGLDHRALSGAMAVAVLLLTSGLLGGGIVRFVFQPDVEGDVIVGYVAMPRGTPSELTARAVARLEQAAREVAAEVDASRTGPPVFAHLMTSVGQQPYRIKQASGPAAFAAAQVLGAHLGEVQIEVVDAADRNLSVAELTRRWRERTGPVPGAEELTFSSSILSAGAPLHIELASPQLEELRIVAQAVKQRLAQYPGVLDLADSLRGGKPELELELRPSVQALGLSAADLGRQVRQAFYGHEVQRIQRGRDEVRVMVRYPSRQRRSLGDLENMRIRTADGTAVPFSAVAHASARAGFSSIRRVDRRRVVSVTAEIDPNVANANELVADFQRNVVPELRAAHPEVLIRFEGEQREQSEFLSGLYRGWIVALLVIYALLAIPLRSYLQPLLIMSAIPFGLVGAVWGHLLMGHDFSMFSMIGLVALSGVVVNDSLVLVVELNRRCDAGEPFRQALVGASMARFRAILLTSLTTFAGLTPLLLETSVQALMLVPMGISLAFGVVAATAITLLLVPIGALSLHSLSGSPSRERAEMLRVSQAAQGAVGG